MTHVPRRGAAPALRATLAVVPALLVAACADRTPVGPSAGAPSADLAPVGTTSGSTAPGRYLLGVAPGQRPDLAAVAASGGRIVDSVPRLGIYAVEGVTNTGALVQAAGTRFVDRDVAVTLDAAPISQADAAAAATAAAVSPAVAVTPVAATPTWVASGMQWDLKAMKADASIAAGARGAGTNVCIIDSGVDDGHQELAGKVTKARSFLPGNASLLDEYGHGTHVAGSVGAKGIVMSGVAPDATIFSARVFDASGSSNTIVPFLQAIVWCTDEGAHVINMSLGGIRYLAGQPAANNSDVQAYTLAMNYATAAGVIPVTSAGNSNLRLPNQAQLVVPAQIPGTIIVGSTAPVSRNVPVLSNGQIVTVPRNDPPSWNPFDPAQVVAGPDSRAYYSNFGTGVDVFAPGGRTAHTLTFALRITTEPVLDPITRLPVSPARTARVQHGATYDAVWSACSRFGIFNGAVDNNGRPGPASSCKTANVTTRYAGLQGTSMAAPHVAGLAAVLYEALGGARSAAARAKVEGCIRSTTDNIGPSTTFGGGRVNAVKALACVKA